MHGVAMRLWIHISGKLWRKYHSKTEGVNRERGTFSRGRGGDSRGRRAGIWILWGGDGKFPDGKRNSCVDWRCWDRDGR